MKPAVELKAYRWSACTCPGDHDWHNPNRKTVILDYILLNCWAMYYSRVHLYNRIRLAWQYWKTLWCNESYRMWLHLQVPYAWHRSWWKPKSFCPLLMMSWGKIKCALLSLAAGGGSPDHVKAVYLAKLCVNCKLNIRLIVTDALFPFHKAWCWYKNTGIQKVRQRVFRRVCWNIALNSSQMHRIS